MNIVEHGPPTTDEVMPTASPVSDDPKKAVKENEEEKYFKKEDRVFCVVCRDDGELISCNKCPASYHVHCHSPAIDLTDISNGEWLCYTCRAPKKELLYGKVNAKKTRSALEILALAASLMNPTELELPEELQFSVLFSKSNEMDCVSDGKVGKDHCLDNDSMVPLPARMCFQCGRSCRRAPLIACDYCPLYFHQDCLDPPLTAFPTGRWICPNHSNHSIDQVDLFTSRRMSKRMKLWDKYGNQSIDQHVIKLDFMRKSTANSLFRAKVRLEGRPRIKVPDSIKFRYKNRSQLDPLHFCEDNFIRPMKNTASEDEQHTDLEETDNSKNNCIKNEKIEEINEVMKEREQCDTIVNEKNDEQKVSDVNECTSKVESKTTSDSSKECSDLEFHARCYDYVKEDVELLERPVLEALAQQRLEQLLNPDGENYEKINCRRRATAALFSLSPKPNSPAFMTRRTFVIGNGSDCDLVLSNYGSCKFTSSKHAIIFFDEATECYELLNYSEYGTVVDNVLYSCDYTPDEETEEKTDKTVCVTRREETSRMIKTILHKNETVCLREYAHKSDKMSCKCNAKQNAGDSEDSAEGWEGSAVIAHGSTLAFGCLMFVFNTLDVYING